MTGSQLYSLIQQTATNLKPKDKMDIVGGLLQSSGISYEIDLNKVEGERIGNLKLMGEPIDMDKSYKVATHSGMLNGIHRYTQFAEGSNIKKLDIRLNAFIVQKFKEMKSITIPKNMGEVVIIQSSKK